MCRNIRNLYNFKPPATDEEIQASSLQFVRKLSGFNVPSKANEAAFEAAVADVAAVESGPRLEGKSMFMLLTPTSPVPKKKEKEAKASEDAEPTKDAAAAGGAA